MRSHARKTLSTHVTHIEENNCNKGTMKINGDEPNVYNVQLVVTKNYISFEETIKYRFGSQIFKTIYVCMISLKITHTMHLKFNLSLSLSHQVDRMNIILEMNIVVSLGYVYFTI